MSKTVVSAAPHRHGPPPRRALLAILVAGILLTLVAAPAFGATHPYTGTDVTQCWACHGTEFNQWQASTPYSTPAYGSLMGHNVNMPNSLTDAEHNSSELLVNDCIDCHSPFSARHQDGTTPTQISELVTPIDMIGSPAGTWTLVPPYSTGLSTSPVVGFYLPADHPTDTTHAAWEGISCRVCHNVGNLDANGLPTLSFFNPGPAVNPSLPAYAYTPVPLQGNGQPDVTWLCDQCHQPNSDDTRQPLSVSVHAGLSCIDCHGQVGKGYGQAFNHDLNAGLSGAPIDQTSCARCHSGSGDVSPGHPDVTKLATSLLDHATYMADPAGDLQVNAAKWHNIHFITCDTCHHPTGLQSKYVVVYGSALKVSGLRSDKSLPAAADDGYVKLWTIPVMSDSGPTGGEMLTQTTTSGAPGTAFALSYKPTQITKLFVSEAKPLTPDPSTSVITVAFPGLGRGVQISVIVKAKITFVVSKTKVHPGTVVRLSGSVAPNKAGKQVIIQKSRTGTSWTTWKKVTLSATSTYSAKWTAPKLKGKYYFRVKYAGDATIAANVSAKRLITVY